MKLSRLYIFSVMLFFYTLHSFAQSKNSGIEHITKVVDNHVKIEYKYVYSKHITHLINDADKACGEFQRNVAAIWNNSSGIGNIGQTGDVALKKIQNCRSEALKLPAYIGSEGYLKNALNYFDILGDKVRAFQKYSILRAKAGGKENSQEVIDEAAKSFDNVISKQLEIRRELKQSKEMYETTTLIEK